jgi:multidrug efflux pump subunit AcrB
VYFCQAVIQAPLVVSYNASSIPVLQLNVVSGNLDEQRLYNYGYYYLRQQLAPVPGVTFPTPDGGKYRRIMVDIDRVKLQSRPDPGGGTHPGAASAAGDAAADERGFG